MSAAEVHTALPLLALAALVLPAVVALLAQPWWTARRHERLRAQPFPADWAAILQHRVPLATRLPAPLRRRLEGQIQVFLAEKPFIGCQGQAIDDVVRIVIAAQACLLLLGHARVGCYPRLRQVLVYPDAFVVQRSLVRQGGVVDVQPQMLAGESWGQGQVILAWPQVLAGSADASDARNVVLHEFAHQIDQDGGAADGQPWQRDGASRAQWTAVMAQALGQLQAMPSAVLDAYGATDPAEFFAVATEAFFEQPHALADEAPRLYQTLADLYRLDPREWSARPAASVLPDL